MVTILDARYEKAELQDIVNINCQHFNEQQKKAMLLLFLKLFEELFNKTLGQILIEARNVTLPWKGFPCFIDTWSYTMERSRDIGSIGYIGAIACKWIGCSYVHHPKKNGTARLILFWGAEQEHGMKGLPQKKFIDVLLKQNGFLWTKTLDLSMGFIP